MENFVQRIVTWREKSLREAKLQTSWETPNRAFEKANSNFVRAILDPSRSRAFLDRLADFVERLAPAGILNSLVQCILRCSCPGIPDLYQGTELWDFSLVDPDNRRPVDFTTRQAYLNRRVGPSALLAQWRDGHVKLALIDRLLALRGSAPECFHGGDFHPLDVRGTRADHVVAFSYGANGKFILVGVPRLCAKACMERRTPLPSPAFWGECAITLPAELRECMWRNALDEPGARAPILLPRVAAFDCALLFADFPAAVLVSES